jgi:two-component system sensor histidine kinase QseC
LLARVEEHAYALSVCRLDEIERKVLSELAPEAISIGANLTLEAPEPVLVQGHTELLEIMSRNLVDNAIRHGGSGIEVVVSVQTFARSVILNVTDTGCGVDADTRAKLGQRFYRPADTEARGSGLGLSLVQRIAELHHGSVEYLEAGSGHGLQVRVTLPAASAAGPLSNP